MMVRIVLGLVTLLVSPDYLLLRHLQLLGNHPDLLHAKKCRSKIYKSIDQCKLENPAYARVANEKKKTNNKDGGGANGMS
jgi:hypothetical protein